MAERELSQISMTSTAHPRATPLFPARRALAIAELWSPGVDAPLLLEWSFHRSWDYHDPEVHRRGSPHWDERRQRVVSRAYKRWASGEEDEEARAAGGFPFQCGNVWPLRSAGVRVPGAVDAGVWSDAARAGVVLPAGGRVVGVSWDESGGVWPVVVAAQDGRGGPVVVRLVGRFGSQPEAEAAAAEAVAGGRGVLLVPAHGLKGQVSVKGARERFHLGEADAGSAVVLAPMWLAGGMLLHDGDPALRDAVLAVPAKRVAKVWDAGIMALVCGWWAHKRRPTATAA